MAKVYVPQEPLRMKDGDLVPIFSLDQVAHFGQPVIILTYDDTEKLKNGEEADVMFKVREIMAEFTEDDYILMTGDFTAMAMIFHEAAANLGRVRTLQWDRRLGEYQVIEVDVEEGLDQGEFEHGDT